MAIVTFVLPAFHEPYAAFVSLGSLLCQTNPNWRAIVVHNGQNVDMRELIHRRISDDETMHKIFFFYSDPKTETPINSRRIAVKSIIQTEWIVSASIQDYFHPNLVEEILKVVDGADLIMWNGMNHHFHDNEIHRTRPEGYWVDWCNMAVRTEVAKRFPIPDDPEGSDTYHADGMWAEALMRAGVRYVKIEKMLVVHT